MGLNPNFYGARAPRPLQVDVPGQGGIVSAKMTWNGTVRLNPSEYSFSADGLLEAIIYEFVLFCQLSGFQTKAVLVNSRTLHVRAISVMGYN